MSATRINRQLGFLVGTALLWTAMVMAQLTGTEMFGMTLLRACPTIRDVRMP